MLDQWNNVTNRYTKTKCNLDYKIVFAFAFMLDIFGDFWWGQSDDKEKRPGYVVICDKRGI